ncbi:MAG: Gmad2 immunoglobulin-like domain-containing protein, partial [Acidimicrobiia bacterium]
GFTMATCGSGCWGEFTFDLDPALLEPGGQVRVFWNSPEDGEPSDVVTIPIPESEDGLWDLVP